MSNKRLIIGLTGPICGGKGIIAEYLKKKGFFYSSTSERVREECRRRKITITRENLQKLGDEMRKKFGPEVWAKRCWEMINKKKVPLTIVDSIRGVAEVDFLKTKHNFYLIGVTAPRRLRFQRMVARDRESDPLSWKEFLAADRKDFKSGQGKFGRDITACLKKSDLLLKNKGTVKELEEEVEDWLAHIRCGLGRHLRKKG
jgi:dephospho-CoA kinase